MEIIHPDTGRPATIASSYDFALPTNFQGRLKDIDGTPSDGYSAVIVDTDGKPVGTGFNYMDGDGWYISSLQVKETSNQ